MLSSSKVYYLLFVLAIAFPKAISYDDDNISAEVEDNALEKEDSEYFTTSDVPTNAVITEKINTELDNDENASLDTTFADSIAGKIEYGVLKEKCAYYKHGKDIDLNKISDVWQVVYYNLDKDIECFKIYMKRITDEEKNVYSDKYGSFSDKVNWTACDLEIRANEKSETQRRHFLQRGNKGIMDNVVILGHNDKDSSSYTLHPEHPDQWLVVNNLLLMRDCNDGDVVVFVRVPHKPRRRDVVDALATFGEYTMEGKTC